MQNIDRYSGALLCWRAAKK